MQFDRIELRFGVLLGLLLAATWLFSRGRRVGTAGFESGRSLSQGLVYVGAYVAFILPPAVLLLLVGLLGAKMVGEWFDAFGHRSPASIPRPLRGVLALGAVGAPWLFFFGSRTLVLETGAVWITAIAGLFFFGIGPEGRRTFGWPTLYALASMLALNAFVGLRQMPEGNRLCLFGFFLVNIADTSAYVCGKHFGRHRLAPAISPGKTVEGSAGSLVVSAGAGLLFDRALDLGFSPLQAVLFALAINLLGQAGDLLTSGVKRRVGIKDFGTLLPGHGGALDRFDSCLLAIPVFLLLAKSSQ